MAWKEWNYYVILYIREQLKDLALVKFAKLFLLQSEIKREIVVKQL